MDRNWRSGGKKWRKHTADQRVTHGPTSRLLTFNPLSTTLVRPGRITPEVDTRKSAFTLCRPCFFFLKENRSEKLSPPESVETVHIILFYPSICHEYCFFFSLFKYFLLIRFLFYLFYWYGCLSIVSACDSLHICTVCIWRCEHASFVVVFFFFSHNYIKTIIY